MTSYVVGIDFSTRAVDLVKYDIDLRLAPLWDDLELEGDDAWDRTFTVADVVPSTAHSYWDDVVAIGIEDPRGHGAGRLYRVQGGIMARIPERLRSSTIKLEPSKWRKIVGLPGNCPKSKVIVHVTDDPYGAELVHRATRLEQQARRLSDGCDAFCIAKATASVL
jgi:hypothetical protein